VQTPRLLMLIAAVVLLVTLGGAWLSLPSQTLAQNLHFIQVSRTVHPDSSNLPLPEKDWTILLYNAADFDGYNPAEDFAQGLQSTDGVHVLMLEDLYDGESTVWSVEGTPEMPALVSRAQWGEIDMGDQEILTRILSYCQENFPSQRLMVMMYQHGGGWRGACYDEHPSGIGGEIDVTFLTPEEMRQSLDSIGGIDALLFTAPCIMGAIEPVYQLRNSTEIYIGSEPTSGFIFWIDALPSISDLLTTYPDLPSEALARRLLEVVQTTYSQEKWSAPPQRYAPTSPALTAIHSSTAIDVLASALDAFSLTLLEVLDDSLEAVLEARNRTQSFANDELIDAYEFARHCRSIPEMADMSEAFMEAVLAAVTYTFTDPYLHPAAKGLSLYFPLWAYASLDHLVVFHAAQGFGRNGEAYQESGLELIEITHWDEFLVAFYDRLLDPARSE
jgi:Clostripain family